MNQLFHIIIYVDRASLRIRIEKEFKEGRKTTSIVNNDWISSSWIALMEMIYGLIT